MVLLLFVLFVLAFDFQVLYLDLNAATCLSVTLILANAGNPTHKVTMHHAANLGLFVIEV
jgi:hypothetical protein